VVRGRSFQSTTDVDRSPVPVMVTRVVLLPTWVADGETVLIVGTGAVTRKVWGAEVPPPGTPVTTVRVPVPGAVSCARGRTAVSTASLTTVVATGLPFHWTTEGLLLLTKFVPVSVTVRSGLPIWTEVGERVVSVGAGLGMLRENGREVPALGAGLTTVTLTVRAFTQ
jgi:hypothetical protein